MLTIEKEIGGQEMNSSLKPRRSKIYVKIIGHFVPLIRQKRFAKIGGSGNEQLLNPADQNYMLK
jgi:hypothetical protein